MFCKNCGKQLSDDAKFCSGCGTPVTPPAPPQEPEPPAEPVQLPQAGFPQPEEAAPSTPVSGDPAPTGEPAPIDETSAGEPAPESAPTDETPAGEPDPEPAAPAAGEPSSAGAVVPAGVSVPDVSYTAATATTDAPKRRGKAGLVVLGAGAVVVILAVVLLVKLLSGLGGGGKAAYAYLTEDGELMYLADLKEKTEALELTDEADPNASVRFSPDGKTVYFKDSDGALYQITASELKKGGRPERVSRNASGFRVLDDGRLLYSESDGSENKLSLYDKGDSFRLIRGYYEYRLSKDQKTLYYTEQDTSDNTLTLYKMALAKDAEEERLLKGATTIHSAWDAETLVYSVEDSAGADGNGLTVYSCVPGGDKAKLVSGVSSITGVKAEGGKVSFYYYKMDVEKRTLYDFVTDAKAGDDASTLNGERPVNPSWYDYFYSYGIDREQGVGYYTDRQNNRYNFDISSLLTNGRTVNDLYYWDVRSLAEAEAHKRYDPVKEDYDARIDAWNQAQSRDYVRQSLKESSYEQTSYSLYHYTGEGKGDPVATALRSTGSGSSSDGIFLYRKVDVKGGKVADVADLSYAGEVYDLLNTGGSDDPWYQNVGGKESELDLDEEFSVLNVYVLNGKEAVLLTFEKDEYSLRSLRSYSIGADALTFTSTILEDDNIRIPPRQNGADGALYLFTDMGSGKNGYNTGDFRVYRDGKLETIAKEIYEAYILDESGAVYAITDIDTSNNRELALLKDGKATTVTDEIRSSPTFLDSTQILYIADGDLMLWNGKEDRRIARDVTYFWASVSEPYSEYTPSLYY